MESALLFFVCLLLFFSVLFFVCGRVPWLYQYWPGGSMLFCVFWPCFLAVPVLARWVLCFLWFYVQELPKAQPAVGLVLKRLRRRGNGLKSHPTDWEKPGIEPAIMLFLFVAVFLGCTSTGRVGLCFLWFFVQELPKAQPAVVLVLKRLRRRGNGLKSHPTDWEKPGIEPATPGLQDIGLSPTPCFFGGVPWPHINLYFTWKLSTYTRCLLVMVK